METFNRITTVCLLLLALGTSSLAWEVNTHRAIDRCAMTTECGGQNKARNLHAFAADAGITNESYRYEMFEEYGSYTYFDYIVNGEGGLLWGQGGISAWKQSFSNYGYQNLIEAGTILEDSQAPDTYHEWYDTGIWESAYGRYNNHYADAQNGWKELTVGVSETDAITWAESWGTNLYNYDRALEYYKKGFTETKEDDRKKYRAKMLVSVGFLLHMLNDMNVPAHVRDDSHPEGDIFEKWMRGGEKGNDAGGFKIRGSVLDNVDSDILSAVNSAVPFKYSSSTSFRKFYENEGLFTGKNFFSKDTFFFGGESGYEPRMSQVNLHTGEGIGYITSNSPNLVTGHNKLGMMRQHKIWRADDLTPTTIYLFSMRLNNDNSVYIDNGINLIPRAVANAEGFINYFFRGRTKASMTGNTLNIKNISDPTLVAEPETVTFKSGGTFWIYYETYNREAKYLYYLSLPSDLAAGDSVSIDLTTYLENPSVQADIGEAKKITVFYDGTIGEEKGHSVAIAKKLIDADVLFSFDRSGSMGSSIEDAKNSAIGVLPILDSNSTFIEVESFSTYVYVLMAYDNNITKAEEVIDTLYSNGGTALYDAIVSAGNNAVQHKNDNNASTSIVILYTDGLENSSTSSRTDAINAISTKYAPEIDEVFLIFVGSDTDGRADLSGIASASGREFSTVQDASGLKDEIEKILKGQ